MGLKSYWKEKGTAKWDSSSMFRYLMELMKTWGQKPQVLNLTNFPSHWTNRLIYFFFLTETPPPGYISEDGETSDQQLNQSMDTGKIYFFHYFEDLGLLVVTTLRWGMNSDQTTMAVAFCTPWCFCLKYHFQSFMNKIVFCWGNAFETFCTVLSTFHLFCNKSIQV